MPGTGENITTRDGCVCVLVIHAMLFTVKYAPGQETA